MKTDHKDVSTERTKQEKLLAEEYRKRESRKENEPTKKELKRADKEGDQ